MYWGFLIMKVWIIKKKNAITRIEIILRTFAKPRVKDSVGTSILPERHRVGSQREVCFSLQGASHTPAYLSTGVRTEWIIGCVTNWLQVSFLLPFLEQILTWDTALPTLLPLPCFLGSKAAPAVACGLWLWSQAVSAPGSAMPPGC